jgi:uncharacterized protein (TIGR02246 family)
MRPSLAGTVLLAAALTLSIELAADESKKPAATADKETVAAAATTWAEAFSEEKPDRLVALYDKEAVLWGTLSPQRRDNAEAIRGYMTTAFAALPGHRVSFGDQLIRVYGNTAINTGYYTFSFSKDGEAKTLPARYSFVYVKRDGRWMIVDHHSSAMPAPPK